MYCSFFFFLICRDLLSFIFYYCYYYYYYFLAALDLHCCGQALSSCSKQKLLFRCSAQASHCSGFSCCGARALGKRASVVVACGLSSCGSRALEHRLSSCDARA